MSYCSNKECNPMSPLLLTVKLKRVCLKEKSVGRCPKCKLEFDIDVLTDGKQKEFEERELQCPKCGEDLKHKRRFYLKCPKCGSS